MQTIYHTLIDYLKDYLGSLEWQYIFNFISLSYLLTTDYAFALIKKSVSIQVRKRYVILVTGVGYAIFYYVIYGSDLSLIPKLSRSMLFALVFHKLYLDLLIQSSIQLLDNYLKPPKP